MTEAEKCAKACEAAESAAKPISYDQACDLVELICANGKWIAEAIRASNPYNRQAEQE